MSPDPLSPSAWSGGKVGEGKIHDEVTPEMMKQFEVMEARQHTMPYVDLLVKVLLERFSRDAQKFFRNGGRVWNTRFMRRV
jgi:uncharacterized protein (DUF4415 family)